MVGVDDQDFCLYIYYYAWCVKVILLFNAEWPFDVYRNAQDTFVYAGQNARDVTR